jgi:TetR/AcrR family transcriptional regulator, transcriptional repressor for nem operon
LSARGLATMKKGERTRERIIRQAAPLFNQRGYDGSSLNEIMAATELEKGGIYRHFASKQELAAAAFNYAWAEAMRARRHDIDSVANSVDKLKRYIANFVERRGTVPGGCPLLNTAMDSDDGNALLRNRARRALENWQNFLGSIVIQGIKKGEIRREVSKTKLANLIIATLEGAVMIGRLEQNLDALRDAQTHLNSYLETKVRATN